VYTYSIVRQSHSRPFRDLVPYVVAMIDLDEGVRMMTNIVGCPQTPEALELDMKLEVTFHKLDDDITLPLFRPAKA